MSDLREQIADTIIGRLKGRITWEDAVKLADTILALIPKPTVRVKCDKCGGSGNLPPTLSDPDGKPCSCTDGWNEHLIEWEWDTSSGMNPFTRRDLELSHLLDTDMAETFISLKRTYIAHIAEGGSMEWKIPHNKGTLRIGGKVK